MRYIRNGLITSRGRVTETEIELHDSDFDIPGSSADKNYISLVTLRDDCEAEDIRKADIESMHQATSPSLILSSQEQSLGDTVGSLLNPISDRENGILIQVPLRACRVLFRNRKTMDSGPLRKLFGLAILSR